MIRAIKVTLDQATDAKLGRLAAFLSEYRAAVNFYIRSLWINRGKLDAKTLNRYKAGSLSYRYRSVALKQALQIVIATRKSARETGFKAKCPVLRGKAELSSLVATVERGRGSFDFIIKISSLVAGRRIILPIKSHARLNHWLSQPGAVLKNAVFLGEDSACLVVEVPTPEPKTIGETMGIDTGYRKLFVDSDGVQYGKRIKELCENIRRSKPGGEGKRKAISTRNDYINQTCKELPWGRLAVLKVEDLRGLKQRTQQNDKSNKRSRKQMAPWSYRLAITRIEQLAQENRVLLGFVDPANTSRECPACGTVAKENRRGEVFRCVSCNHTDDADTVGAVNILARPVVNWADSMVPLSVES